MNPRFFGIMALLADLAGRASFDTLLFTTAQSCSNTMFFALPGTGQNGLVFAALPGTVACRLGVKNEAGKEVIRQNIC